MAQIKAGMLCWLVGVFDPERRHCIGRVVTAVAPYPNGAGWYVKAKWLEREFPWLTWAETRHLRPITDPDAGLTETHDMQDNLLAVLPYTRTDPAGDSLLAGEMA
jgi:hypothetical protein